jgi:hypothetical protein
MMATFGLAVIYTCPCSLYRCLFVALGGVASDHSCLMPHQGMLYVKSDTVFSIAQSVKVGYPLGIGYPWGIGVDTATGCPSALRNQSPPCTLFLHFVMVSRVSGGVRWVSVQRVVHTPPHLLPLCFVHRGTQSRYKARNGVLCLKPDIASSLQLKTRWDMQTGYVDKVLFHCAFLCLQFETANVHQRQIYSPPRQ